MRTPFEVNYSLLYLFYVKRVDWGLYLRLKPRDWLRVFWAHPEADVIWFDIGPFAFFRRGV